VEERKRVKGVEVDGRSATLPLHLLDFLFFFFPFLQEGEGNFCFLD
jgi:hypothetical protein